MVDDIVFSRDVAALLAQVAPVLVIAFVVEFRALAEHVSVQGGDLRALIAIVFSSFGALLITCLLVVNGSEEVRGYLALLAWTISLASLSLLIVYVAFAAWAAVRVITRESVASTIRTDARAQRLKEPGWKWLLRGQSEPLHVVAAVITRKDGSVLACRRAPGKVSAGKWEFPGGKVEKNEYPADALVREIREELSAGIRIIEPLTSDVTVVRGQAIRLSCYLSKVTGKLPMTSTDHDRLEWIPLSRLTELDWAAPDLPAVRKLMNQAE